jgi:Spy/CpxP family protein refolding chaperone
MPKIVLLLCLVLSVLACAHTAQPLYNAEFGVPTTAKMDDIPRAIKSALIAREWTIQKEEQDKIEARIFVRSHKAEIVINYTAQRIRIQYVSSDNLDYSKSENTIHRNYNKWIHFLERDISSNLVLMQ